MLCGVRWYLDLLSFHDIYKSLCCTPEASIMCYYTLEIHLFHSTYCISSGRKIESMPGKPRQTYPYLPHIYGKIGKWHQENN